MPSSFRGQNGYDLGAVLSPAARQAQQLAQGRHQVGLYTSVRDIETLQLKHSIVGLTRAMLTQSVRGRSHDDGEDVGPQIPELAGVLHGMPVIERTTVNGSAS